MSRARVRVSGGRNRADDDGLAWRRAPVQPEGAGHRAGDQGFSAAAVPWFLWFFLSVETAGSLGPSGGASALMSISNVNTSGAEYFTATTVASSCTADGAGTSGFTVVTDGMLQTVARQRDGTTLR